MFRLELEIRFVVLVTRQQSVEAERIQVVLSPPQTVSESDLGDAPLPIINSQSAAGVITTLASPSADDLADLNEKAHAGANETVASNKINIVLGVFLVIVLYTVFFCNGDV